MMENLTWRNWSASVRPPRLLSNSTAPELFLTTFKVVGFMYENEVVYIWTQCALHLETKHRFVSELNIIERVFGGSSSPIDGDRNSPTFFPRWMDPHSHPRLRLLLNLDGDSGESRTVERFPNLDEIGGNGRTVFLVR